jgi:molybdopterin-guanine dinucleotide biosynthesis protein A
VTSIETTKLPNILAVIMIGGKSSRMGIAKHLLQYKGLSLLDRLIGDVSQLHLPMVISCKEGQLPNSYPIPLLYDMPTGKEGPLNALLTSSITYPSHDKLLLSIDMPRVDHQIISSLTAAYKTEYQFTGFKNKSSGILEPFPAIYHHSIPENSVSNSHSLFSLIKNLPLKTILDLDTGYLVNINTPEMWNTFKQE